MAAENTNSREFRTKLSEFMDIALGKPVSVTRGKDRFVLMNEEEYLDLKDELLALQRNFISVLSAKENPAQETYTGPEEFVNSLFEKTNDKVKKIKKVKQA